MSTFTSIYIETLILVAVWEQPLIFQGCFKLTDKNNHNQRLLFFVVNVIRQIKKSLLSRTFLLMNISLAIFMMEPNLFDLTRRTKRRSMPSIY